MDNEYEQDRDFDIYNGLSDDDEPGNVQRKSDVVQSMFLFKLNFEKDGSEPKAKVRAMIEECNLKTMNDAERYLKLEASSDEFAEIYKQTKHTERSTALYNTIIENKNETTNYITVYYADGGDVYAQTTGQAWRIASKYGDTNFPLKIARRLLDTNGMKDISKIPLSGNTTFQRKRCKEPERSYECGTQNVRVRFVADLRPDASIRDPSLNCFEKSERKIKVKVGIAFIQFDCSIKMDGMRNFINHLNRICNEEATFTTNGRREENTDAFDVSLREADAREAQRLESVLKNHMELYVRGIEAEFAKHLNGLDLCQRSVSLFSYANDFKISFEKKNVKFNVDKTPTLKDSLDILSKMSSTTLLRQSIYPFEKIRIKFQQHDKHPSKLLLDLVEGTMMYEDQMYYRICKKWYCMSEDHIRNIHITFRSFLRDHLVTDEKRILPFDWNDCDELDEGDYNNLYMRHDDFLVGDGCLYGHVELFDLLRYDPDTQDVYLYHVKKNLQGDIRVLAFQLMTATDILRNAWNADALQMFRAYHASIMQKYRDVGAHVPKYFSNFDDFRSLLSRTNKLTIICAVLDRIGIAHYRRNSISRERGATDYFGVNNIVKAYQNKLSPRDKTVIDNYFGSSSCSSFQICRWIFELLIDEGYVKESDKENYGYSTSKLLLVGRDFKISEDGDFNTTVWKLIRPFGSLFNSTGAKYSLMHMQTHGFPFKICQINRY